MKKLLLLPILLLSISILVGCWKTEVQTDFGNLPPITVQEEIKEPIGIIVTPTLTDEFVNKYQYEDSCNFRVALNVDGKYFDTFRNENNWVANSYKHSLNWAIAMCNIATSTRDWLSWNIKFWNGDWANDKDNYWFHKEIFIEKNLIDYELFISWVKEGVDIAELEIEYIY